MDNETNGGSIVGDDTIDDHSIKVTLDGMVVVNNVIDHFFDIDLTFKLNNIFVSNEKNTIIREALKLDFTNSVKDTN